VVVLRRASPRHIPNDVLLTDRLDGVNPAGTNSDDVHRSNSVHGIYRHPRKRCFDRQMASGRRL